MQITTFGHKSVSVIVPSPDYQIKYPWLEKLLLKLGLIHHPNTTTEEFHQFSFDEKDFVKRLMSEYYNHRYMHRLPKKVYMGPSQFEDLVYISNRMDGVFERIKFHIDGAFRDSWQLFGLDVEILPYMDGVLFV